MKKNSVELISSILKLAEERINEFGDRLIDYLKNREKERVQNEQTLREMWDTIKCTNIPITEVSEGEKGGK